MNLRCAPVGLLHSCSTVYSWFSLSFAVLVLFISLFGICGSLLANAFAQDLRPQSTYGSNVKSGSRPELRDRWMMRGRTAPAGQTAAALRLRAYRQKMVMRAAAATQAAARPAAESGAGSGTPWVPLGPAPLISDQGAYGAVSGRAISVALDPSDPTGSSVYVAGASGGVWKSTNAANVTAANVTWTPLTDQQASLVNGAVSVNPDGSVVLVGTGEADNAVDSYYGVGILRSADHGNTWSLIPSATGNSPALSFAGLGFTNFAWNAAGGVVAATATTSIGFDDGDITSSTNRGLYYSGDSGQTWTYQVPQDSGVAISPASISATDVVYDSVGGRFIAAVRYHGLYSSTNGTNWTRMANQPVPLSVANCPVASVSTCPIYRGQLAVVKGRDEVYFWFISLDPSNNVIDEGIWQSINGGTWAPIDETGIANCGDPGEIGCGVDQGYYNLKIAAMPDGAVTDLYAGAVNLFKCELTTGAATCATVDTNFPNQWINLTHVYGCSGIAGVHPNEHGLDFVLAGGKAVMYFANDGGIYRTLDGFTQLKSGTCGLANGFDNLNGTIGSMMQFTSLSLHPSDQTTLLGGTQSNGSVATSSATATAQWTTVNGGDGGYNAISAWTPLQWYTSTPYGNIYMCTTGVDCTTDAFSLAVGSEEVGGDFGAFYTPYILDPQNQNEMFVGTCRVWRGAPTVPPSAFAPLSIDFDTLGSDSCTGGEINLVSGMTAGGPTADFLSTTVYATTEGTGPNVTPAAGGEVWVTANAGIAPMAQATGNINPSHYTISSVAVDTNDATGATAYVGIMGFNVSHVFKTTNAGTTWADWSGTGSSALPSAPVNALLVDASTGTIYAGTDVGVFMSSTGNASWSEVGTPSLPGGAAGYLPDVPVSAIRMFNWGGTKKLRVSTYGRGVWEYALAAGPDYTNVIANTPQTVYGAQSATFNGTLTATNGYASAVNLTCTGNLPTQCSLTPAKVTPSSSGLAYTMVAGGAIGDYTFNAHAVGTDSQTSTHDAMVTLHVVDFNISLPTPDAVSGPQGGTSNAATFQVTGVGSFSGTVTLSCSSGLPAGAACVFSPSNAVKPTATDTVTVTLTVTTSSTTPQGGPSTVMLAANVAGAPAAKTQTFAMTVGTAIPDFTLAVTTTPSATVLGQNVTWNGTLTALRGYATMVNLSCVGTVPGTCSVSPASLLPTAAGAAFTVTAGNATPGAFSFGIQGTDGTLTHSQAVNLAVNTDVTWTGTGSGAVTVQAGQSAQYSFLAAPVGGATFNGTVSFACANLPALATCSFSPPSIGAGVGTTAVTMTIATTGPEQGSAKKRISAGGLRDSIHDESHKRANAHSASLKLRTGGWGWFLTLPVLGVLWTGFARRRVSRRELFVACLIILVALSCLLSCGGAVGGGGGTGSLLVTVSPSFATVVIGAQQQFTATQNVTWDVTGGSTNGTIDVTGLYTAPAEVPVQPSFTVTATPGLNGGSPGSATVTVTNPALAVTVSPALTYLFVNEPGNSWPASAIQQQFIATVNNGGSQAVTWAVSGGDANGTIDANGLYTSPAVAPNPASVTVTATSTLSSTPGSAIVNVQPATALGTFSNIQVTATATGGTAHTDVVSLTVQ